MRDRRDELEDRTQAFAQSGIDASIALENIPGMRKTAEQLNASATSVGSNHRAMRLARSDKEFAAKLQIVVEEADESVYWLEIAVARPRMPVDLTPLLAEARELRAIFKKARMTNNERMDLKERSDSRRRGGRRG